MKNSSLNMFLILLIFTSCNKLVQSAKDDSSQMDNWIWDGSTLKNNKSKLASGHTLITEAYDLLIAEANEALKVSPVSVMDKSMIAASDNKHDYFSFGPYWWPDPEKPDGLPYIRKDGVKNSITLGGATDAPTRKIMRDVVETLALAYFFSDDEKYAKHAVKFIEVWFIDKSTRMNPNMDFAQAIPGIVDGRGIGIIESRDFIQVAAAIDLLRLSNYWTVVINNEIQLWYSKFLDWMVNSKNGRDENNTKNNHATWYDCQIVHFAYFVNRKDLARGVLKELNRRRMEIQIEANGSQPLELTRTRSFDYSMFNLEAYLSLARLAKHLNIDIWKFKNSKGASLKSAVDFIGPYTNPIKNWPYEQIRDSDEDKLAHILIQTAFQYPDEVKYMNWLNQIPKEKLHNKTLLMNAFNNYNFLN